MKLFFTLLISVGFATANAQCSNNSGTVFLTTDQYGNETSWALKNSTGTVVASGSGYAVLGSSGTTSYQIPISLPYDCYDFLLYDSYGDGICCAHGNGSVSLMTNCGVVHVSKAPTTGYDSSHFCVRAPVDAGIVGIEPAGVVCDTVVGPIVELKNHGINTLTSATISYGFDGMATNTQSWTGSLGSGQTVLVSLPAIATSIGSHTLDAHTSAPNGSSDNYTPNDAYSTAIETKVGAWYTVVMNTDQYGGETSWLLHGSSGGALVGSGGNYPNLGAPGTHQSTTDLCLADGCYTITVNDSYGDGMCCTFGNGNFSVVDNQNNVLANGAPTVASVWATFCVTASSKQAVAIEATQELAEDATVLLVPNPIDAGAGVVLRLIGFENGSATAMVIDALGRVVMTQTVAGDRPRLRTDALAAGLYLVTVGNGSLRVTERLVVR